MNKDVFAVPLASLPRLPTPERELTRHPPESTPFSGLEAERGSVCLSIVRQGTRDRGAGMCCSNEILRASLDRDSFLTESIRSRSVRSIM